MKMLVVLLIFICGFMGYVRYLEKSSLFFPYGPIEKTPSSVALTYEDVFITTKDKLTLHGWFVPHPEAKATVLFLHGNAGNIADRVDRLALYHRMGLNTLIVDYRGYGQSDGKPTEKGLYIDAVAMYDYLKERLPDTQVIIYGSSLGGVYAIDLALKRPADALVVEASFSSAKDMAKLIYPFVPSFMVSVQMNSLDKIKHIKVPKIFFHSKTDRVVPYELGYKLFESAPEPKEFVTIIGEHVEGHYDPEKMQERALYRFFQKEGLLP